MEKKEQETVSIVAEGLYTFYHSEGLRSAESYEQLLEKIHFKYINDITFHARVGALVSRIMKVI